MTYRTIRFQLQDSIARLQLERPAARNAINSLLIEECLDALGHCTEVASVLVVSGSPEVFCVGADFDELRNAAASGALEHQQPQLLYDLWTQLAAGPFVSVAQVRGKVNAGGVGFVAACDIVLADEQAQFSLSELLFGLLPACVLPFLIRRIGFQRAHYLTLTTQPIGARQARDWGLVDALAPDCDDLLRQHLLRLRRLSKPAVARYKRYVRELHPAVDAARPHAVAANLEVFSDPANLAAISRYVDTGRFPWER
jgi:polyketide biosynthesis enoyl-CoA hydratase PksH